MPRLVLALLIAVTPAWAQQMPAPVERPLEPVPPSAPQPTPPAATGGFATVAPTVTAVMGYAPSATLMVKPTPTTTVRAVVSPPPQPKLTTRAVGPNRYIILPQESPLATAPLATLSPATLGVETETALPETPTPKPLPAIWHEAPISIPSHNLAVQPSLATVPTQPEEGIAWQDAQGITWQQTPPTLPDRLNQIAERLESVTEKAAQMESRLAQTEDETEDAPAKPAVRPAKPAAIPATVPYVNDATSPGPRARAKLDELAAAIIAAHKQSGAIPKSMSVAAIVAVPPFAAEGTATQLARARHLACWRHLNARLKPAGLKLPGTGNKLTIKPTDNPSRQSQTITINW